MIFFGLKIIVHNLYSVCQCIIKNKKIIKLGKAIKI